MPSKNMPDITDYHRLKEKGESFQEQNSVMLVGLPIPKLKRASEQGLCFKLEPRVE